MVGLASAPGNFSIRSHGHRIALHPHPQFQQHLFRGTVAPEQIEHSFLQCMVIDGAIDLRRILLLRVAGLQRLLGRLAQQALQIGDQYRRLDILPHGLHGQSAPILQIQTPFEHLMIRLVLPAPVIDIG